MGLGASSKCDGSRAKDGFDLPETIWENIPFLPHGPMCLKHIQRDERAAFGPGVADS